MRFREDTPEEWQRALAAVQEWRAQHPDGTAEDMLAALAGDFHEDYGAPLRAALFRTERRDDAQIAAGVSIITGETR